MQEISSTVDLPNECRTRERSMLAAIVRICSSDAADVSGKPGAGTEEELGAIKPKAKYFRPAG